MIAYAKYPNFPGGNTPDPRGGKARPPPAPTPAQGHAPPGQDTDHLLAP